jgi:hypothetical protein
MTGVLTRTQSRPVRWGWLVVAVASAAAVLGVLLSVRALTPESPHSAAGNRHVIGDDVPTSFGIVAVEFVRSVYRGDRYRIVTELSPRVA